MSRDRKLPTKGQDDSADVDAFLRRGRGDARTGQAGGDRAPYVLRWTRRRAGSRPGDRACQIQGGDVRRHGPRSAGSPSSWSITAASASARRASGCRDSRALVRVMTAVRCLGGHTQIRKVLRHALDETQVQKVHALVFVGDSMEENVDELCAIAGELGLRGVPRLHVPRGAGPVGVIGLSPDRAAHQRRLSAFRCIECAPAQGAPG